VLTTFTLTPAHRAEFDRVGVLRLPAFYPAKVVAPMADALWSDAERRLGVRRNDPDTWTTERVMHHQELEKSGAFAGLATPALFDLANAFLGEGAWDQPKHWGQPLFNFPTPGPWRLPSAIWHLDYPTQPCETRLGAIRTFTLLEPVRARGGGTLFVAGSHKVAMAMAAEGGKKVRSADMRARLKGAHPWFALLWAKDDGQRDSVLFHGAEARGVHVRVAEMTGEPGDVLVMHPNMLHGLSKNVLDRPRMALVQSLMRRDAHYW
jgi:hypothetical protein